MPKNIQPSRRTFLGTSLSAAAICHPAYRYTLGADRPLNELGYVVGEPTAEMIGSRVLADGGNAIDAIVAAALAAAVAAPNQTGIGGYGMSAMIAFDSGRQTIAIDGNSTAPASMTPDFFQSIAEGKDSSRRNEVGWQAAGVPGIMAGLFLAAQRFGTRPFRELLQPAIKLARDGYAWPASLATTLRNNRDLVRDAGSKRLYYPKGEPLAAGEKFQNPELAAVLETLASANSVEPFYRGDIAQRIADGFAKNNGLVTVKDLANYEAKIVTPLSISWNGLQLSTVPLTAGGLTVLQILNCLAAMDWQNEVDAKRRLHAYIEASRLAWHDRLTLLGDPQSADIPTAKLLSPEYAAASAARIGEVVQNQTLLRFPDMTKNHGGTIHLSSVDREGNMAALTLTHGEGFGAKITVEGLGLTLGHGMSRFDVRPNHPNAPGPGKRPLHNMVPTIGARDGKAVLAVGGRGGRKIPNALLALLVDLGSSRSLSQAMNARRLHTEGGETIQFEPGWDEIPLNAMRALGYQTQRAGSATLSAVAYENGQMLASMR